MHAIGLLQHLYTPNLLILIARILAQVQITGAADIHPTRSLFALSFMLSMMNIAAVLLHMLDFVGGMSGGKGVMLDFVGQAHPASMSRILLLDLLLFLIQLTSLIVSYVNYHSNGTSSLDSFPFDDLLLPPSRSTLRNISAFEDDDVDLETGELAPNRRKSRNASYKLLDGDADGESLDEDDEPTPHTSRKGFSSSANPPIRRRRQEPPLIFSLSLQHICKLIFTLPILTPAPRTLIGETPAATTPIAPGEVEASPLATESGDAESVGSDEEDGQDGSGRDSPSARRWERVRGAAGLMPDIGRIPGEYRSASGQDDGG